MRIFLTGLCLLFLFSINAQHIAWEKQGNSIVFSFINGQLSTESLSKIRITPYGDYIFRIEAVKGNDDFNTTNNLTLNSTLWNNNLSVQEETTAFRLFTKKGNVLLLNKEDHTLSFFHYNSKLPFVREKMPVQWQEGIVLNSFVNDHNEHFSTAGFGLFAEMQAFALKGRFINKSVASSTTSITTLPFFLSSKGYGILVNNSLFNEFNFGENNTYGFSLKTSGPMDYYVISGPELTSVLHRYKELQQFIKLPQVYVAGKQLSALLKDEILRYQLAPYLNTYAQTSDKTKIPGLRPLYFDFQNDQQAWKLEQYMLGQELMLAKIDSVQGTEFNVWLPPGNWFDFHNDSLLKGGKIILYKTGAEPPVFVKQGSIIPMYNEPTGTNIMHDDSLTLHVYPGKNASFELFEGEFSPNTTNSNNYRTTRIDFNQAAYTLTIAGVKGNYKKGATQRRYKIEFHGSPKPFNVQVNGMPLKYLSNSNSGVDKGVLWDSKRKVLIVLISKTNVNAKLTIKKLKN